MTFMEKAHKEIQFIDLLMIVIGSTWLVIAALNLIDIIKADLWFFHFIIGSCVLLWGVGFHTRWKRTGAELEIMAKKARFNSCCCEYDQSDMSSMYSPGRKD